LEKVSFLPEEKDFEKDIPPFGGRGIFGGNIF